MDSYKGVRSATYSNVPVIEFEVSGTNVMRRRVDDWINATHILKAAGFDKPARTRILEREIQKGVHEKVQGGYGKYQGTWIPLQEGRELAERNNVLEKLAPILDYVAGGASPPPAQKHATAQAKPRATQKATTMAKRLAATKLKDEQQKQTRQSKQQVQQQKQQQQQLDHVHSQQPQQNQSSQQSYFFEGPPVPQFLDDTPEDASIAESMMDDEMYGSYSSSQKRRREEEQISNQDREHLAWSDALLDYFVLAESGDVFDSAPAPPPGINLDLPINEMGHYSALHWAASMGDVEVVQDLISRGARIDNTCCRNMETPLMRAVIFTNSYDKKTMEPLVRLLQACVHRTDELGSTVFHHIAASTVAEKYFSAARYYMEAVLNTLAETWVSDEIVRLLNFQDRNGDTAIHIAARNGARKCVRSMLGRHPSLNIPNHKQETADEMIRILNERRRAHGAHRREASSSPFGPDRVPLNGIMNGLNGIRGADSSQYTLGDSSTITTTKTPVANSVKALVVPPMSHYRSQTANSLMNRVANSVMAKCRNLASVYENEFEEKEAEAIEHEQVVRKRNGEIEALTRQAQDAKAQLDLLLSELGGEAIEAEREREEAKMRALEQEALSLLEYEHRESLRLHVSKQMRDGRPPVPTMRNGPGNEDVHEMATLLLRAQHERQRLTSEIVKSLSVAGLGEKTGEYKRLICGALNVREDEVQSHLDDIIGQLEEERRERLAVEVDG